MERAYTRTYRFKNILMAQGLALMIIIVVASCLIFYAQGYSINLKSLKIIKNGLLVLNFEDKPDSLKISGKEVAADNSVAKTLQRGEYKIVAEKAKCGRWERNIKIEAEKLTRIDNIIFFKNHSDLSAMTQDEINWMNSTPDNTLAESSKGKLSANDYEIWLDERLIMRLSSKISQVKWYPDNSHFTFVSNDEIRIVDIEGFNDTTLIKLDEIQGLKYLFRYQGKVIYFRNNNKHYKSKVRCE